MSPQRLRAAMLTLLLGLSGWLLAAGLLWGLDALGLPPPKLNVGSGVAAGGAAVAILFMFAALCAVALLVAAALAVLLERRRPAAWRHAALAAGLGVGLPSLLLFFDGPGLNAVLTVTVPAGLLLLGSRFDVKRPYAAALATPGVAMALGLVVSTLEGAQDLAQSRERDRIYAVQDAADARDAGALKAVLDGLPEGTDLDSVLMTLPMRGEHRAELEAIARHPKAQLTPCSKLVRASLDGDPAEWRYPQEMSSCRLGAAGLAVRQGSSELLEAVARAVTDFDDRTDVLDQLAWANDDAAAVRWLAAAELANDAGVLKASLMTSELVNAMWRHDDREFYWAHCDADGLLVAVCANDAYEYRLTEALQHGARVNARMACGTTPLISICTGHELNESAIGLLLDAGADPNLRGAAHCLDGDAGALETPLWHLVRRRHDWNNPPASAIELLIAHGANAQQRGLDGGTLFDEASDDESTLKSLHAPPLYRK